LIDKNIQESDNQKTKDVDEQIAEKKAFDYAKEHFKDDEDSSIGRIKPLEENTKQNIDVPMGVPLAEEGDKHEHVFFDEEDTGFKGWSPGIPSKDKKDIDTPPITPGGEIQDIDIGEVKAQADIELPKEVLSTKSVKLSDLGFSENEWEELDFYSLHDPFSYVEILREKESLEKCYFLVEISLTDEEEQFIDFIHDTGWSGQEVTILNVFNELVVEV